MPLSRRHWWGLLVVCSVACLVRCGVLAWQGERLQQDVDAYLEIARNVVAGNGFAKDQPPHATAYRPPLLPLLIALILKFGGSPFVLGIVHAILGTLTTALTFRVGWLLHLGRASFLAAGLVAIDPLLLQNTVLPMTETLCATLVIAWCWTLFEFPAVAQDSRRVWPALVHGAVFGLICLCRPAFLAAAGLAGVVVLFIAFRAWREGAETSRFRRISTAAVCSLMGLLLVLAPWVIRNGVVIGKPTPATTHGGYTLLLANNPVFYHEVVAQPWGTVWQGDSLNRWQSGLEKQLKAAGIGEADEVARDGWMYRQAYHHIQAEPSLFVRACAWRAVRFWDLAPWRAGYPQLLIWGTAFFYGVVSCGMVAGLCSLRRLEWAVWWPVLLLPFTLWVTHWVYWTDMRMRAPVIPIVALLVARGCVRMSLSPADPKHPLQRP